MSPLCMWLVIRGRMIFGTKELDGLAAIFNSQLPDETGMSQLGLILIKELREARIALVEAAIPLEALLMVSEISGRHHDMSLEMQESVAHAVKSIRAVFTPNTRERK